MIRAFIGCAMVVMLLCGCKDKRKPDGVPNGAIDIGGPKKRQWAECIPKGGALYFCSVYIANGTKLASGYFTLTGGTSFEPARSTEYVGFDGDNIRLSNERILRPLAPPRPTAVPVSATWSGGPTCGAFIDCSQNASGFLCRVYDDSSGEIVLEGRLVEVGSVDLHRPLFWCRNKPRRIFTEDEGFLELRE